jgi:hypothetical protein
MVVKIIYITLYNKIILMCKHIPLHAMVYKALLSINFNCLEFTHLVPHSLSSLISLTPLDPTHLSKYIAISLSLFLRNGSWTN